LKGEGIWRGVIPRAEATQFFACIVHIGFELKSS
jgi:hypothetical protein